MTIHQTMAQVFQEAEIPGFLQAWKQTEQYPVIPDKFCTYIVTTDSAVLSADDVPAVVQKNLYIHMFGKTDISTELDRLNEVLEGHDFLIPRVCDLDDVRSGEFQYHKRIDLIYIEYE